MTRMHSTSVGTPRSRSASLIPLALLLFLPGGAGAQSLFSAGGLGVPSEPLDARARALGGVGMGLTGSGVSFMDPTASAGLLLPTVTATMQALSAEGDRGGASSDFEGSRFPHVGLSYPVGERGTVQLQYGSFLDQRWSVDRLVNLQLAGGTVQATDRFEADGGVSTALVGGAIQWTDWLALGGSAGVHTGIMRRTFIREFNAAQLGGTADPFVASASWTVTGPVAMAGVRLDPSSLLRLSASVLWSGDLSAEAESGIGTEDRSFPLPLQLRGGLSVTLTPQLNAVAGLSYADWKDTGDALTAGAAGRSLNAGGGVEWTGNSLFGRTAPLRIGFRRSELPFELDDAPPTETSFSLGGGLVLAQFEGIPLAALDVAVERGERAGGGVSETFWRATTTLRLSGR